MNQRIEQPPFFRPRGVGREVCAESDWNDAQTFTRSSGLKSGLR